MQTKYRQLAGILVLAIGGLTTGSASSAVLYDNTGGGVSSAGGSNFFNNNNWGATLFTASGCGALGCALDKITLRLATNNSLNINTGPLDFAKFDLSIWGDLSNPGSPPASTPIPAALGTSGTALAPSMSIYNPTGATDNPSSGLVEEGASGTSKYYEFTPVSGVTLYDNFQYWVRLTGKGGDPSILWDLVAGGNRQFSFGAGGSSTPVIPDSYVMKVEASSISAVPIPGAVWLMGSALVGFVGWGRRHQV
ncbi:MAG: hypothetical protein H6968_02155 [Chromatiaceae bacterium]|nr:hypothetical protein [Chromatiaceae bacterium]MCP5441821.1 hypothetical protein [Chromatiaceae bacterium]